MVRKTRFHALLVAGVLMALAIPAAVNAQGSSAHRGTAEDSDPDPDFAALDADQDGRIDRSEARQAEIDPSRFQQADSDGDGQLSEAEYGALYVTGPELNAPGAVAGSPPGADLGGVGHPSAQREDLADGNGGANATGGGDSGQAATGERAGTAGGEARFSDLDTDGNGYISRSEASGSDRLIRLWQQADTNGDDRIDSAEFSAFEANGERRGSD